MLKSLSAICGNTYGESMAKVIGVLGQKGGCGKTTTSINLACALHERGNAVMLVDSDNDTQASSLTWSAARKNDSMFPVVGMAHANIHKEVPRLSKGYDYVVIDGPPHVANTTRSIILASDIIIIPVQPSPLDVWAANETVRLVKEGLIFKENLQIAILITRKIANTAIGRDVVAALEIFELPVLTNAMMQRVIYAESLGAGQSVFEVDPGGIATQDVSAILNEILEKFTNEQESCV
jgi:chromosome partitioning protein